MLVTVNTDASVHGTYPIAAYAYWIVSNEGVIKAAAPFKDEVKNATIAEAMAIVNALTRLYNTDWPIKKVVINTDCKHFLVNLSSSLKNHPVSKEYNKIHQALAGKHRLRRGWLEVRHVKAHKHVLVNGRDHVNHWCDNAARDQMRKTFRWIKFQYPELIQSWNERHEKQRTEKQAKKLLKNISI